MTFSEPVSQDSYISSSTLTDICKAKRYSCYKFKLPTVDEILSSNEIFDVGEQEFLHCYLDYEVFLAEFELEEISKLEKIPITQVLENAVALLDIVEKAKRHHQDLVLVDNLNNINPIKI